jgi:hypothetical protein
MSSQPASPLPAAEVDATSLALSEKEEPRRSVDSLAQPIEAAVFKSKHALDIVLRLFQHCPDLSNAQEPVKKRWIEMKAMCGSFLTDLIRADGEAIKFLTTGKAASNHLEHWAKIAKRRDWSDTYVLGSESQMTLEHTLREFRSMTMVYDSTAIDSKLEKLHELLQSDLFSAMSEQMRSSLQSLSEFDAIIQKKQEDLILEEQKLFEYQMKHASVQEAFAHAKNDHMLQARLLSPAVDLLGQKRAWRVFLQQDVQNIVNGHAAFEATQIRDLDRSLRATEELKRREEEEAA